MLSCKYNQITYIVVNIIRRSIGTPRRQVISSGHNVWVCGRLVVMTNLIRSLSKQHFPKQTIFGVMYFCGAHPIEFDGGATDGIYVRTLVPKKRKKKNTGLVSVIR